MSFLDKIFRQSPEERRASEFLDLGLSFSSYIKSDLSGESDVIDDALNHNEFLFYSVIVALAAADFTAIIKYGPGSKKSEQLLGVMIKSAEKANPHVRKNLMYHKSFLDAMEEENRLLGGGMTIPQASGCWILMALRGQNTIDLDDQEILEAGRILGDCIYNQFATFWDDLR